MFEVSPVGMLVVDRELRLCQMNRAIRAMNGLSTADIGTKSIAELLPDVKPPAWDVIREVFATGRPRLDVEITGTTPASHPDPRVWLVSHYPITDLTGTTTAVGVTVVDVTEQRRAEAARDAMQRRLGLLTRASGLIGVSLDLATTLDGMINLVVPDFADNSELLLTDEPLDAGLPPPPVLELRRVGGATQLPGARPVGATPFPLGERMRINADNPGYQALVTRQAILFEMDERVVRSADFPDRDEFFEYIAVETAITVPLLVGHEYHGAVYFGLGASGRTFTEYDVQTAVELGSRIAYAVANARAFDRQRRAAVTLQRGLLPGDLPAVEGLDVAWRYEPGTAGTEVGGDWFDVVPLSAGRVGLVIGDVMGRGLTAAAVMGQIRTAVRAFAALDLPAADVLTHLDELVQNMGAGPDGALVSCIYAIFEPATATITVANAGHLPPALIDPDAGVVFIDDDHGGIILGVTGQTLTETRRPFPPGATLALYTDGLVESPAIGIEVGTRRLRAALAEPGDLHTTADRLLTIIDRAGDYDDDIALLLVRATAPATVRTCVLPPDPRAAKTARDTTRAALETWHLTDYADLAELLVSELVTNSIRYANTPSHLTLRRGQRALHVEVADGDSRVPRLLHPTADDEGGRGLQLVAELATAWGARPTRTGKTVWFELALSSRCVH